jgi:hypothetical protein
MCSLKRMPGPALASIISSVAFRPSQRITPQVVAIQFDQVDRPSRTRAELNSSDPMRPSVYWLFVFIPITVILDHTGNVPPR